MSIDIREMAKQAKRTNELLAHAKLTADTINDSVVLNKDVLGGEHECNAAPVFDYAMCFGKNTLGLPK